MSNFDKAIEIILAEPPELHYPAYYADLLREADVPDKNVGKCSEIPNSSDTISRQAAIDEIGEWIKAFRENGHKESAADARLIQDGIIQLPSAQPEIIRCKDCKWKNNHNCTRAVEVWIDDNKYCAWAERRTDGRINQQTGGD